MKGKAQLTHCLFLSIFRSTLTGDDCAKECIGDSCGIVCDGKRQQIGRHTWFISLLLFSKKEVLYIINLLLHL